MSAAQSVIAGMITPALLILASASLVATALVRLARVVDRSRALIAAIDAGPVSDSAGLQATLERHRQRGLLAERSVGMFFGAVVILVVDCLSIGLDHFRGNTLTWLPISLTIAGLAALVTGAAFMVAETQLSSQQLVVEISGALARLRTVAGERSAPSSLGKR